MPPLKDLILEKERKHKQLCDLIATIKPQWDGLEEEIKQIEKQIEAKTGEATRKALDESKRETGTVNYELEGVQVKAVIDKRVRWDQVGLAQVFEKIRATGDDPAQYLDIGFSVQEKKYSAWPDQIKAIFAPHRTVTPGKPRFEFSIIDGGKDAPPWEV